MSEKTAPKPTMKMDQKAILMIQEAIEYYLDKIAENGWDETYDALENFADSVIDAVYEGDSIYKWIKAEHKYKGIE